MTKPSDIGDTPVIKTGITGNMYVYSSIKDEVEKIAEEIGKSTGSVYFNKKYRCYAIRIKSKTHKERLKQIMVQ